ncbi:hypothetical protein SLOPH_2339 [Spraguea lophii 42_110]|uniref:Uncharacterized protein n=1 Tax=Spraguea lophii (strain 42_110) TaxID=1358809 RepID=S7W9T4_SPRLO|nr:hypothetical protein SLOPH_2339 [Spraguea lophii 42_110]
MQSFLIFLLSLIFSKRNDKKKLVFVRNTDKMEPLKSCVRRGYGCVMVTSQNIKKFVGILKVNRIDGAVVGGWNGQKLAMVLRANSSLTPYDPETNFAAYVMCVKKRCKPNPKPCPPCTSDESSCVKPSKCKKMYCEGKIYGEIETCKEKEESCCLEDKPPCVEKPCPCPSESISSCLPALGLLLGSACINPPVKSYPEICLPPTSCIPKPPYPKPCFPGCKPYPRPPNKISCCPKIPYCPTPSEPCLSPCPFSPSYPNCNLPFPPLNSISQLIALCKKSCGSSSCSSCLSSNPNEMCDPLKKLLYCIVSALSPCLKPKISPCLSGTGSASGCASGCAKYPCMPNPCGGMMPQLL